MPQADYGIIRSSTYWADMARAHKKGQTASLHDGAYAFVVARLVERRKAAGLSQQALADLLGWQQSIIAKIETVQRRLDIVEFLRLTTAIGVDPVKLLRDIKVQLEERGGI